MRRRSRARPLGEERLREEMDDASGLTDHDDRAIESIRRKLDMEFPHLPRKVESAEHLTWDAGGNEDGLGDRGTSNRTRWAGTVVGMLLLLACAVAGAAGASAVILYLKNADSPAAAHRQAPRPRPETPGAGSPAQARIPPPPAPPREVVETLPPRPQTAEPGRLAQSPRTSSSPPPSEVVKALPPRPKAAAPGRPVQARTLSSPAPPPEHVLAAGAPISYYYGGRYFRYSDGAWSAAERHDGPWRYVDANRVPGPVLALPGLQ